MDIEIYQDPSTTPYTQKLLFYADNPDGWSHVYKNDKVRPTLMPATMPGGALHTKLAGGFDVQVMARPNLTASTLVCLVCLVRGVPAELPGESGRGSCVPEDERAADLHCMCD